MRTDIVLLDALIDSEKLSETELEAFTDMREFLAANDLRLLTPRQRAWAQTVAERLEVVIEACNDWSRKSAAQRERIRGAEVAIPEARRLLPLKPPGHGGGNRTAKH